MYVPTILQYTSNKQNYFQQLHTHMYAQKPDN